jgi:hypothetical protein
VVSAPRRPSGWSLEEPTCSLNLSPERFLQYVVYLRHRDADPTSWSHTLPLGQWTHFAVVNDGKRTVIYVDGSKIARNPTQESRGISTMGKPCILGGTRCPAGTRRRPTADDTGKCAAMSHMGLVSFWPRIAVVDGLAETASARTSLS